MLIIETNDLTQFLLISDILHLIRVSRTEALVSRGTNRLKVITTNQLLNLVRFGGMGERFAYALRNLSKQ